MRKHPQVAVFNEWLIDNYLIDLRLAPVNSMTPFLVDMDGKLEYMFIVKGDPYLYAPLKNKSIDFTTRIGVKAYFEGRTLIWGFNVEPDISLESEIPVSKIVDFLKVIKHQDLMTVAIVDHESLEVIWLINNYPFKDVRSQFEALFAKYGV